MNFTTLQTDLICREINPELWFTIEDFCIFLKLFSDATALMSASVYFTLPLVLPVYQQLEKHVYRIMQANDGFRFLCAITFARAVQSNVEEYEHVVCCREVTIAAVLDPEIKSYLPNFEVNVNDVKR